MKRCRGLVIFILIFSLSACSKDSSLTVYEYSGLYDDSLVFSSSGDIYEDGDTGIYDNSNAPRNRVYSFFGTEYQLNYKETFAKEFFPYAEDYYYANNNSDIKFSFKENTDILTGVTFWDGVSIDPSIVLENEEDYISFANNLVDDYIVLDDYVCSVSTLVYNFVEEDGIADGSYNSYDYFYKSSSSTEHPRYTISYTKYLDGFKTCEMAVVSLNPDGSLHSLQLNAIGLFDQVKLDGFSEKMIETAVSSKLEKICNDGYRIQSNTSQMTLCIDKEGKPFFVVVAKPEITSKNTELQQETCIFIIPLN